MPVELVTPVIVCAVVAALCFVVSLVVDEYSWVDRMWSIIPPVYVGLFAAQASGEDARLNLMTALTVAWGARLTFNYARKGGYQRGGEDYRWSILRARMSKPWWLLFNLGFIAGYQNVLLLLITLPAFTALQHKGTPLGALDVVAAVGFVVLLVGETVADQQQWRFHQQKKAGQASGFLDRGLWAWSRHPNFFCEQGQWAMIYLFAVAASGQWLLPTVIGPVLLVLLFAGSARFTESITAAKYPGYRAYQERVSQTIPWFPKPRAAAPVQG